MGHSNTDETVPEHNFKQQTGQVQPNVETYEFPLRTSKESLCKRPTRLQTPFCSSSHKFCCCTHANQLGDDDLNRVRASEIISRVSAVCWMLTEPRQIIKEKKKWKKKKITKDLQTCSPMTECGTKWTSLCVHRNLFWQLSRDVH